MENTKLSDLCVAEIMSRWPATIEVFIDCGMYCVGCPIGVFHTLDEAAREHDFDAGVLRARIEALVTESVEPDRRR